MNYDETDNFRRNDRFSTVYGIALRLDAERTRQMREIEERRLAERPRIKWWQRIFQKKAPVEVAPETPQLKAARLKLERASQIQIVETDATRELRKRWQK